MWDSLQRNVEYFAEFYYDYAIQTWRTMGPPGYAAVLITIAVIGYILMKSGVKTY